MRSQKKKKLTLNSLPDDLLTLCFDGLMPEEQARARSVSKRFNQRLSIFQTPSDGTRLDSREIAKFKRQIRVLNLFVHLAAEEADGKWLQGRLKNCWNNPNVGLYSFMGLELGVTACFWVTQQIKEAALWDNMRTTMTSLGKSCRDLYIREYWDYFDGREKTSSFCVNASLPEEVGRRVVWKNKLAFNDSNILEECLAYCNELFMNKPSDNTRLFITFAGLIAFLFLLIKLIRGYGDTSPSIDFRGIERFEDILLQDLSTSLRISFDGIKREFTGNAAIRNMDASTMTVGEALPVIQNLLEETRASLHERLYPRVAIDAPQEEADENSPLLGGRSSRGYGAAAS